MANQVLVKQVMTADGPAPIDYTALANLPVVATESESGFMSPEDRKKLNGIETGANKTVIDSELNENSTNPVENKIVTSTINNLEASINEVQSAADSKAPQSHASTATTYGIGTDSEYGHVKLSDATDSASAASAGIAASPKAVKDAYDLANAITAKVAELNITTELVHKTVTVTSGMTDNEYGLFPAPANGFYFINAFAQWDTKPGGWRNARLSTMVGGELIPVGADGGMVHHKLSDAVYLNEGTSISLFLRQTSGEDMDCIYGCRYSYIPL